MYFGFFGCGMVKFFQESRVGKGVHVHVISFVAIIVNVYKTTVFIETT